MQFKYKIYVPSRDDYISVRELKTREYLSIVKTVANKQPDLIEGIFDDLLVDLTGTSDYNRLDKFFILCTVRAVSVGGRLSLSFLDENTKKPYKTHIQILQLLQEIADVEVPTSAEINVERVTIKMNVPTCMHVENIDNLLYKCVEHVQINNIDVDMKELTIQQQVDIVDNLPVSVINGIKRYVKDISDSYSKIVLYKVMNPHSEEKEVTEYYFNMFSNIMYEFLCAIYNDNLKSIYELLYVLTKRVNISMESLYNHTYAEVRMYLDIYEQELKMEEEARKKERNQNQRKAPGPIGNPIATLSE